jgi:hypothetical protein
VRELTPIAIEVAAPRVYVFRCLTAFGEPSPIWRAGRIPELLDRKGSVLTVRFRTRLLGRATTTIERVRLQPPHTISFEHVEGPFSDLREVVELTPLEGGRTRLEYRGDMVVGHRLLARIFERLVAAPLHEREMQRRIHRWRVTIEAAARASGMVDAS